jgi:hypothetical protein
LIVDCVCTGRADVTGSDDTDGSALYHEDVGGWGQRDKRESE